MEIKEKMAEALTAELISFPSMTGSPEVGFCAEFIRDWLRKREIQAEIINCCGVPNVVARLGRPDGKRLLLDGHFDVVPPGNQEEWNSDPFKAVSRQGFLYGRGVSDMKSGVAAAMLAMEELKQIEEDLPGEVVFYGIGDEETGSVHGTVQLLKEYDCNFDGAIVPEPSDFCIERAQRGLRWIEIHVRGRACHAGRPHVGKNAIEQAARMIQALKDIRYQVHMDIFEDGLKEPSLSVNRIQGGIQNNVVAEDCTFLVDRRLLPGETVETVLEQIRETVEGVLQDGFTWEMKIVNDGWDPFITPEDDPVVEKLTEAFRKIAGTDPVIRGKGGCTDASHIHNAGIPVVILGPGSANESHTSNEKCEIKRIAQTAMILREAVREFLKD